MKDALKKHYSRIFNSNRNKIVVLTYHRISDVKTDPWQIAVSPENFEEQIKILKNSYQTIDLKELNEQMLNGEIKDNQVLITFDDAYSDNYRNAMPLLEKYDCPATLFVPTSYIGKEKEFWSDELASIILLTSELPKSLTLMIGHKPFNFTLKETKLNKIDLNKHRHWKLPENAPTERCQLYYELWKRLRPLRHMKINNILEELKQWAELSYHKNEEGYPMSKAQLKDFASKSLFDIGIHTHTHPSLGHQLKAVQESEIYTCKSELEKEYSASITSIAYPYGCYNNDTLAIVNDAKIPLGFSTKKKTISKNDSILTLGRFQPLNWDGNNFKKQLKGWFHYCFLYFLSSFFNLAELTCH